jgi:hypothetical protein
MIKIEHTLNSLNEKKFFLLIFTFSFLKSEVTLVCIPQTIALVVFENNGLFKFNFSIPF